MARGVKNLPAMQETQETQVQSLGWEDPLLEENGNPLQYSCWRTPWTEEPGSTQVLPEGAGKQWHPVLARTLGIHQPTGEFGREGRSGVGSALLYSTLVGNCFSSWSFHSWSNTLVVVLQSLSHVRLFATPWTAAHRAPLSFTISRSVLQVCVQ